MGDPLLFPKLRWPIDLRFETHNQQEILLITCPLGIAPGPLGLIRAVAPILSCFEGSLSVQEITAKFATQGLNEKTVLELISLLDRHTFLTSPTFEAAAKQARNAFSILSTREPALAGLSYAGNAQALSQELDSYLKLAPIPSFTPKSRMHGLVSPHIDYNRGKHTYGATYSNLAPEQHDLFVLIGTSHQYSDHLFHITNKNFASPLGTLAADIDAAQSLGAQYGIARGFADEFLHRREHSLELQVPFLARLKGSPKILPILVGSFHHMITSGRVPETYEPYEAFASALTNVLAVKIARGERVCFLAGVDMAHVGKSFGDSNGLSPEFMEKIEARDRIYLDTIAKGDKLALFAHVAEDGDSRRLCGFPTMYTVLDVLRRLNIKYKTELFEYRQSVDYQRECAVTFAGMGLYTA